MKVRLLFLVTGLILCAFAALLSPKLGVMAIDALTDNATMPDFFTDNQSQDEIKPRENCVLVEPPSQPEGQLPHIILGFTGDSKEDNFKITANETWHLNIDINAPGWLYIYEYFPSGKNVTGEWIAYKWEFTESGHWKLGPFIPRENELEGQHIYRAWFYSDGHWADEESSTSQNNIVFWTYSKDQSVDLNAEQITPQPEIIPAKEATLIDNLRSHFTPLTALALSCLIFIVILGSHLLWRYWRWRRKGYDLYREELEDQAAVLPSAPDNAKILLPNGIEIKITNNNRIIGRGDLSRALGLDELGLISRRHFEIKAEDHHFYIEDLDSTNGTILNGEDISGKGFIRLSNDDIIEPAGIISLKFYLPYLPQDQL